MTFNAEDRAREIIKVRANWVDGYVTRAIRRAIEAGEVTYGTEGERAELTATAERVWAEHHPALLELLPAEVVA